MLTVALNAFFCMTAVYIVVKSNGIKSVMADIIFLLTVIVVMYFMNVEVIKKRCGSSDGGVVAKATIVPWTLLLGGIMIVLRLLPGWKQPFSNTFGYLVVLLGGGKQKLRDMLQTATTPSLQFVQEDPWRLLSNFSTVSFDATLAALRKDSPIAEDKIAPFRKIVLLKDLMSEMIWFMLVGAVAITLSYTSMTAYKCQLASAAAIELPKEQPEKVYFSE
jgi:hypothetical protein